MKVLFLFLFLFSAFYLSADVISKEEEFLEAYSDVAIFEVDYEKKKIISFTSLKGLNIDVEDPKLLTYLFLDRGKVFAKKTKIKALYAYNLKKGGLQQDRRLAWFSEKTVNLRDYGLLGVGELMKISQKQKIDPQQINNNESQ